MMASWGTAPWVTPGCPMQKTRSRKILLMVHFVGITPWDMQTCLKPIQNESAHVVEQNNNKQLYIKKIV